MPSNLPFSTVVIEIVRHTPTYAWLILAALVVLGSLQMGTHVVGGARLALAPLGLGAYSLWGATAAFGAGAEVIGAWAVGEALAIVANRWLRWPREVRAEGGGRYALHGSPWPLVAMLSVFALRYAVAVTLVFHSDWAAVPAFGLAMALLYGALSGLFAGRALRILQSAPSASGYVAA